ncbi:MAG: glycosyltransferase family 4 protein [Chloroflexota bacterium]
MRTRLRNGLRRAVRYLDRAGNTIGLPPMETIAGRLLGRPLSPLVIDYWQRYPNGLSEFVAELQARFRWDAVIVEYIWLHRSIDNLKNGIIRLLDTHDIQYKRVEEFTARGMVFPLKITRDEERRIFERFDAVIAIQSAEANIIRGMCPRLRVLTVGSSGYFPASAPSRPVDGRLLYVGGYNGANIDGLRRFLHGTWPEVLRQIPGASLHVCGHIYRAFGGQRFNSVKFLGHKENLDQEYAEATVVINPAWIGTGLKIKTIEALNRGKPLVTTRKGIEGLPHDAEPSAFIAEDDESFASAVVRLMTDPQARQALSRSALVFANAHLNKRAVYQELFQFLERADES